MLRPPFLFALTAFALSLPATAKAEVPPNVAQVEVLHGWRHSDGTHRAAVSIRLAPGWKTYWRTPGAGGIPPMFNWSGSVNLGALEVSFPVPEVFDQNGMRSIGYLDEVVLPIIVTPGADGTDVELRGEMEIGVCLEICVPITLDIAALLPADLTGTSQPVDRAFQDRPLTASEAKAGGMTCEIEPITDGLRVTAALDLPRLAGEEVGVLELPDPGIWISEAELERVGSKVTVRADMVPPQAQPFMLARDDIKLTVIADGVAVEIAGCD